MFDAQKVLGEGKEFLVRELVLVVQEALYWDPTDCDGSFVKREISKKKVSQIQSFMHIHHRRASKLINTQWKHHLLSGV